MKKIKTNYDSPKDYCDECKFYLKGNYNGYCILDEDMGYVAFGVPNWCPFNDAEECEE